VNHRMDYFVRFIVYVKNVIMRYIPLDILIHLGWIIIQNFEREFRRILFDWGNYLHHKDYENLFIFFKILGDFYNLRILKVRIITFRCCF